MSWSGPEADLVECSVHDGIILVGTPVFSRGPAPSASAGSRRISQSGEVNKRIPEYVSVLGRGNLPIGAMLNPALTTFAIQPFETGRKAAETLLNVIQKRQRGVRQIYLDDPLIKRGSA